MLANLFGLFMSRNSGWESSHTRTSTIMQLRMVRANSCNSFVNIEFCMTTSTTSIYSYVIISVLLNFFAAAAAMEMHRNAASSSGIMGRNMNE